MTWPRFRSQRRQEFALVCPTMESRGKQLRRVETQDIPKVNSSYCLAKTAAKPGAVVLKIVCTLCPIGRRIPTWYYFT